MKQDNLKPLTIPLISIVTLVAILFLFQNCADPLDLVDRDAASFAESVGFAYNTTVDTLSYMSCSGVSNESSPRSLYSFRVGSYTDKTGLKLSDEYRQATSGFTVEQRAQTLAQSPKNRGAQLQLAIRRAKDYQVVLASSGSVRLNHDYTNLLAPLDLPGIAQTLSAMDDSTRLNYFSFVSGLDGRMLEGSLRFMDSELSASSVREHLGDTALLALTYTVDDIDSYGARGPGGASNASVYGRGLRVGFRLPPGRTAGVRRALNDIIEVDLLSGATVGSDIRPWECPGNLSFTVVRPEDLTKPTNNGGFNCQTQPDRPHTLSSADRARLEAVRRVLRVEDYWVDLAQGCVVPKPSVSSCYGPDPDKDLVIRYLPNQACDTSDRTSFCAHHVSLCLRQ